MSEPKKDFRPAVDPRDHRVLLRISRARGISMQELGREIIAEYVHRVIHDAKVVLGQDDDNADAAESHGKSAEEHGNSRNHRR